MDEPNWLAEVNSVTLWFALSRINTCNVGFVLGTKLLAAFSGLGSLTVGDQITPFAVGFAKT